MPERTALYRFYGADDRLLYVGVAKDIKKRWKDHELVQRWWHLIERNSVTWLESREAALAAEATAVDEEAPLYNAIRRADGTYDRLRYDDSAEVQRAASIMRRELADGTLGPGAPIHVVRLARRYEVSAISVLSALAHLPPGAIIERGNKRFVADPARPRRTPRTLHPVVTHGWFEAHGFPG